MNTPRDHKRPLRVAQIGPWPSPWGGISVYVQRLARTLAADGVEVVVLDTQEHQLTDASGVEVVPLPNGKDQSLRAARIIAARGCDVAHLHLIGFPWKAVVPFVVACEAVGVPLVVSVHSFRVEGVPQPSASQRLLLRAAAKRLPMAFASGEHVAERLLAHGAPKVEAVAPFVPPIPAEPRDARLPAALREFCARHQLVVAAGAAALTQTPTGEDLYGFDTFVATASRVATARPDVGFVFQLPRRGDQGLFDAAMARAGALGDRLLIHQEPLEEGSDLWAVADVFIRPTRSDGDSVSVREALSLGTPCLTTDVVHRPEGVYLYPTGDADAAATLLDEMLSDLPAAQARTRKAEQPSGATRVHQVLREVAAGRSMTSRALRGAQGLLWRALD